LLMQEPIVYRNRI